MEMKIRNNEIIINEKAINNLDKFVLSIVKILEKYTNYVIISGYVSIFFGRTRATEDVDVLIEKKNMKEFLKDINDGGYWVINTSDIKEALSILDSGSAIRIAKKRKIIPNIEIKFSKNEIDFLALKERMKVKFDKEYLYFSPIELQIVFKIFLGSDKDIEDAKHLYNIFKEKIDINKIESLAKMLKVYEKISLLRG